MQVDNGKSTPRPARRLLEQQRQEGAFRQPQRERARQRRQQRGLSLVPELDATRAVDAVRAWTRPRVLLQPSVSVTANRKAPGVLVGVAVDAALRRLLGWPTFFVHAFTSLGVCTGRSVGTP